MGKPNGDRETLPPETLSREIKESWNSNAAAWIDAVRESRIASRGAGTNDAVLRAVSACSPRRVLDVGCGEGWLTRSLTRLGYEAVGIDGSRELVTAARALGEGAFHHATFEDLEAGRHLPAAPFDAVVCSFSLFEEELKPLLRALGRLVFPSGCLILQTLHPSGLLGSNEGYRSRWMLETFASLGPDFTASMPYFHRTYADWIAALGGSGWQVVGCGEPVHPETGAPLSLVLTAKRI